MGYKKITELEAEKLFNEWLDEAYPSYKMGELGYSPSQILRECDPIGYRCGLNDWLGFEHLEIGEPDEKENGESEDENED